MGFQCLANVGFVRTLSVVGLLGLACGCSDSGPVPTVAVTGTVKLSDGTPLEGGRILFRPDKDAKYSARGAIGTGGVFELTTFERGDGAIAGSHRVMVSPPVDRDLMDEPVSERERTIIQIDRSYQHPRTTPLVVTVTSDGSSDNHFDLIVEPPTVKKRR